MTNSLRAVRGQQGLCIVAAALLGLTACGGGSSAPPVAQTNPSATPSSVAAVPSASSTPSPVLLIPRMTGTGTVQTFRNQGFTCTQMQPPQPSWNQYDCYKNSAYALQQETIDTMGPGDQVANLEADTLAMSSIDAQIYLGDVAAMPFTGSQATQAREWIATSISKPDAMTDIGGVHFELVAGTSASVVRLLLNNS